MRIVHSSSEDEVVATFLRAEIESPRYREPLLALLAEDGAYESLLTHPDVGDAAQNAHRLDLLDRHRCWVRRDGLFTDFPERLDWFRAALAPDEVLAIRYIDWDYWQTLSDGTQLPVDAARRIRAGEVDGQTPDGWEPLAARLASPDPPPELIAAAPADGSSLVAIEGHVRLTAYALFPEYLPESLEILLGLSDDVRQWWAF